MLEDAGEDRVFGEEPRERRYAGDRERRDQEGPVSDRQLRFQSAHLPHVLFAAHRMDDRARPEEEAGLERMRHDVEHAGHVSADAAGEEHVAQLRDRRVGEHLLDVVLRQGDDPREDRGYGPDHGDDPHRLRREAEKHVAPRDHVDAGRDHRRGVDERGDGGRAGHRVGKPDVKRDLRALADGAEEEAEANDRQGGRVSTGVGRGRREHAVEVEGAEEGEDPEHPEKEPEVPDAVDDEGLLAGVGGVLALVVVPDQEVGAEAHAFPPHEQQQEVLGEDEGQHREHEEIEICEVPRVARLGLVVPHVADGIHVDPEADEGHEGRHQRGQGIEAHREVRGKVPGGDPGCDPLDDRRVIAGEKRDDPRECGRGREPDGAGSDGRDKALAELFPEKPVDGEARERQRRDEPERQRHALTT